MREEATRLPGRQLDDDEIAEILKSCQLGASLGTLIESMNSYALSHKLKPRHRKTLERYYLAGCLTVGRFGDSRWPNEATVVTVYRQQEEKGNTLQRMQKLQERLQVQSEVRARRMQDPQHQRHLERVRRVADDIRRCVYNPHLEIEDYTGFLLELDGCDWSLEPTRWLALTTPDFSDPGQWGDMFEAFRAHTKASKLWEHLNDLRQAVERLEVDIAKAAKELAESEEGFGYRWQDYRAVDPWVGQEDFRTRLTPDMPKNWIPTFPGEFNRRTLAMFESRGWAFYGRLKMLVEQLQRLQEDLLPDRLDVVIANGECPLCPHNVASEPS